MASLIAILDLKGKPLIQRSYRDDVPLSYVERFLPLVLDIEEEGQQVTPCFSSQGVNYMHIRHSNLYLLALSKRNTNAAEIIIFLHRLTQVLVEYFKELEEESIRDNFVIIYELMDEMMDFGYPQTTESKILQEYITQESHKLEVQVRPPMAVTNAVSWRTEGIRYRKNEVFLDVIESVNMLVNANGNVVRSEILGAVKMKCYLSGMPELRLGLNDKVMFESTGRTARGKAIEMEDVKFHQCVRLSRFENDRTISFIPPDGEFELMSYRLSTPVKPLVWVEAAVESHKGSRVEYVVKVKAQFKRRSTANNVEIYVPVPDDADSPKFRASTGTVQYAPDKSAFVWKIKQLGGSREFLMRAHFGLPSVKNENDLEKRAPITVKFEIPYFTVSGIQVRYLKIVEKSGYQALPWVRYITQNGDDYRHPTDGTGEGQRPYSADVDSPIAIPLPQHHDWFTATLTFGLCCGLIISYAPQHLRIINKGSSEGFSPWFLLLGSTSSAAGFLNMVTMQWRIVKCCPVFSLGSCLEMTAGIVQVGLQWFLFTFVLVLYMIYYPPHLKYAEIDVDTHDTRPPVHVKTPIKSDEWRLSITLSWVVAFHLAFITFTTFFLLLTTPTSPSPNAPLPDQLAKWATFLGVSSALLAAIQYAPQLAHTYKAKLVGALSIPMMCIQSPGAVFMVLSIALRPGTNWTSWITFAVSGIMQGSLLIMCIVFTFRQRRLGIDEFGHPLSGTSSASTSTDTHPRPPSGDDFAVPGLVTIEEDPVAIRVALAGALESAVESDIRPGEEDERLSEQTPLLGPGKSTESVAKLRWAAWFRR
ncbi:hypothetical protein D9615_003121 [Tricholomella constricta]|uniref:MHD domain-containing protein n=1 Tax=Tricholomella constricta TaxID=117010 RepID=A0A8H5HJ00_9AGAR|nr:hypothetical protein D9615_003121 [Tricholomella constricta]